MTNSSSEPAPPEEQKAEEKEARKSSKRERHVSPDDNSASPPIKAAKREEGESKEDLRESKEDKKESREEKREKGRKRKEKESKSRGSKKREKSRRSDSPERRRKRKDKHAGGDLENDERSAPVVPAAPPRPPTARELERKKLLEKELQNTETAEDEEPVWSLQKAEEIQPSRACPYLDTINRGVLDFDFEKLCSVSLSHLNVYACLVCGKYFQGRGTNTHAYTHSLDTDHRVFINLQTLKFYCLPDNYEVIDPSLDDIKYVLKPSFTTQLIASLDSWSRPIRAFDDSTYYPGVVGLNNIKANDYENVILHALSQVPPLRDYFLQEANYAKIKRPPGDKLQELTKRFGELIRKLWNPKAFKAHVSPHEMLQATVLCSNKQFQFIKQGDASEFLNFLLNTLHVALNGTNKTSSSIIYKVFRGRMRVYTRRVVPIEISEEQKRQLLMLPEYQESSKESPFLYLTLDLPPAPLYRDELLQNIIPQVPLHVLLQKFNGQTEKEYKTYNENLMKRFELLHLPEYLMITNKRFHKNQWFVEKNPTIVNFPISNVDLYECIAEDRKEQERYTTYDLVANIVHDGPPESGSYRIQILHTGTQKWFELEDLHVKDILPQMITLAESYIQVWRLNREKTREERLQEAKPEDGVMDS